MKLSLSSINGYRSMLSRTLACHRSSQVCSDPAISELIRAMELKRPVSRSLTPLSGIWHVFYGHLLSRRTNLLIKHPYSSSHGRPFFFLLWPQPNGEVKFMLFRLKRAIFVLTPQTAQSHFCVNHDSLPKINSPLWLPNHSRSEVFQRPVDKTMRIDFSAQSGP